MNCLTYMIMQVWESYIVYMSYIDCKSYMCYASYMSIYQIA